MPVLSTLRAAAGAARRRFAHLARADDTKVWRPAPFVTFDSARASIHAPRDYAAHAREGFMQNAVVYRCVRMIAENVAAIPLLVYDGDGDLDTHPLLDLVRRPNPHATRADFLEELIGYLLVSGNAFVEAVSTDGEAVHALYNLRPDRITVQADAAGWPSAYVYAPTGRPTHLEGDAAPGVRRVLHLKQFHPLDDHYGMSPIEAAAEAIDLHNTASRWNKALLDNSARPSGALVYTARDGNLTSEQFERLKRELEAGFQGALNAGRPLLLEGGLDWKAMSMSPKDLDFIEARNAAAREIALSLGVPPQLLGIPGDNTYANYQEANRAFFRQTILPLLHRITAALTHWLAEPLSPSLSIRPDLDQAEALTPERDALWQRLNGASFLTQDEKRAAAGYAPAPPDTDLKRFNAGQLRVPAGNGPESGRWARDDGDGDSDSDANIHVVAGKPRGPTGPAPPKPATSAPTSPQPSVPIPPGTTIRNKDLAGKKHPETNIPFDKDGFPDFSGVATKSVNVPHTGDHRRDNAAANYAAGLAGTPPGMTWHHHQNGTTIQLVPADIHSRTGHTGSIGIGNTPGKRQ